MSLFHTFLIIYWAANAVATVALIDTPYTITRTRAAITMVFYGLLIWATVVHAT